MTEEDQRYKPLDDAKLDRIKSAASRLAYRLASEFCDGNDSKRNYFEYMLNGFLTILIGGVEDEPVDADGCFKYPSASSAFNGNTTFVIVHEHDTRARVIRAILDGTALIVGNNAGDNPKTKDN